MPCDQYAKRYQCQQALIKKWWVLYPSCNKWQMTWIAHNHHQCSIILNERGKHSYSIYWTSWRFLRAYAGLFVNAKMIALFSCQRLDQNGNCGANADNNKSWPKSLIISDYGRIWYYNWILLKFGRAPITNMISNTYCTVSVIPYWELTHQANPNIHCTLR
jgi:hypothetical protein